MGVCECKCVNVCLSERGLRVWKYKYLSMNECAYVVLCVTATMYESLCVCVTLWPCVKI